MITIHQRAEQVMRESRGKFNLRAAYQELSRRSAEAKARKKRILCTIPPGNYYPGVERPYIMPFDPSN